MTAWHTSASSGVRLRALFLPIALVFILACFFFTPLPENYDDGRDALVQHMTDSAKSIVHTKLDKADTSGLVHVRSKYAFATFLSGQDDEVPYQDDHYFIATRILTYQLLHAPETRSVDRNIPFIVLVTDKVPEHQRKRLRQDGAIVVPAPHLRADWINAAIPGWDDVMTKLRLWELSQFDRICFLDGDTVLMSPLDGVFSDPAVADQFTGNDTATILSDEGEMPSTFVFAGTPEMNQPHGYPPTDANHDFPNINYLNAGFFVLKPSLEVLGYYVRLLNIKDRFDSSLPEQNLLNYAHRREGNMAWTQLNNTWNIHYPTMEDVKGGVKSIHDKWWWTDPSLTELDLSWRWRMEGFYEKDSSGLSLQGRQSRDFVA